MPLWKFQEEGYPKRDTGLSKNGGTNSETSANISDGKSNHINLSFESAEDKRIDDDRMDETKAYIELIKSNIEYDYHIKYEDWSRKALYDEWFDDICDVEHFNQDRQYQGIHGYGIV